MTVLHSIFAALGLHTSGWRSEMFCWSHSVRLGVTAPNVPVTIVTIVSFTFHILSNSNSVIGFSCSSCLMSVPWYGDICHHQLHILFVQHDCVCLLGHYHYPSHNLDLALYGRSQPLLISNSGPFLCCHKQCLCCLSVQLFGAIGRISQGQPSTLSTRGIFHAGVSLSMMAPLLHTSSQVSAA